MHTSDVNPILIYDSSGIYGPILAEKLPDSLIKVLVSPQPSKRKSNLFYIPLKRNIPSLPACTYSSFFLFCNQDTRILSLLPFFLKKQQKDKTKIYILVPQRQVTEQMLKKLSVFSPAITIILLGDFFGELGAWNNPVVDILHESRSGIITLAGSGLERIYPVYDEDAFALLVRLAIQDISIASPISLLSQIPVTSLSLARFIHTKEPLIALHLVNTGSSVSTYTNRYPYLLADYSFHEKLPPITIDASQPLLRKRKHAVSLRSRNMRYVPYVSTVFIIGLLIAVCLPIISAFIGAEYLNRAYKNVLSGDLKKAHISAHAATQFFTLATKTTGAVSLFETVGLRNNVYAFINGIETGKDVSTSLVSGIDGLNLLENVFLQKSKSPENDLATGMRYVRDSITELAALQIENKVPEKYKQKLASLQMANKIFAGMFDVIPEIIGMNGERTYLLLFQNNMELRPGGGFIGSFGILRINKGKIVDLTIHDVYDADGQLKEAIEPPFQLKRYMNATHWFMRDSNFDVDFPKSAASSALFYNLETGGKVDGVIGIDTSFIKNLLEEIGPIRVPDYNETVSAENFFLLAQKHTQENFFPGSTQKKDFLQSVYTALSILLEGSQNHYINIANAVTKSVSQKHILFAFPNKDVQKVFSLNGFSSTLQLTGENTMASDFLGINEANIGANKVNYYLDRAITHNVQLQERGNAAETVTVQYNNKSSSTDAYGGDYKTYIRIIVPTSALLESISFDGVNQTIIPAQPDFPEAPRTVGNELEVEKTEEAGKTIYGFFTSIPLQTRKTITIYYSVPFDISQASNSYSLHVFKQPGTNADPYAFSLQAPNGYEIHTDMQRGKTAERSLTYFTDLNEDRDVTATIIKK